MTEGDQAFLEKEQQARTAEMSYSFKMYDDDGNLYCEGYSNENNSFDPLDEFGSELGCTEIRYLKNGQYVRL